jgi:molecular chaperone DnaJ
MLSLRGSRQGDLYVQLLVRTPRKISKKQKELLEQFAALGDPQAAPTPSDTSQEADQLQPQKKKRRWGSR